jgi:uncharacterized protein (TIGR00251 family)
MISISKKSTKELPRMARLRLRVKPCASRDEVTGMEAGVLLVRLCAVPKDGAANKALVKFLAQTFKVPKTTVTLERGQTARIKTVEFATLSDEDLTAGLAALTK